MGWFRAGFLPTVYALEKSFCAREAALKFGGGVERLDGGLVRPTPASILTESERWDGTAHQGQARVGGGVPHTPVPRPLG